MPWLIKRRTSLLYTVRASRQMLCNQIVSCLKDESLELSYTKITPRVVESYRLIVYIICIVE